MANATCSIPGCARKVLGRGWCGTHYSRWKRTGTTDPRHQSNGCCSVGGCDRGAVGAGLCQAHYFRLRRNGSVGAAQIGPANGRSKHRWKGDAVGYMAAHTRVRNQRGKASCHPCSACPAQANDWAYDNADSNERIDDRGRRYSLDVMRYQPLCHECHMGLDLVKAKRRPSKG